jgi:hypothetical protein
MKTMCAANMFKSKNGGGEIKGEKCRQNGEIFLTKNSIYKSNPFGIIHHGQVMLCPLILLSSLGRFRSGYSLILPHNPLHLFYCRYKFSSPIHNTFLFFFISLLPVFLTIPANFVHPFYVGRSGQCSESGSASKVFRSGSVSYPIRVYTEFQR